MKQLDDFEKYLRDQLKGHTEPDPLMWKRLSDALGRVQPWYARNAFKYALTAFGSLLIGVITTYTYLENKNKVATHPIAQHSSGRDFKNNSVGVTQKQQTASLNSLDINLKSNNDLILRSKIKVDQDTSPITKQYLFQKEEYADNRNEILKLAEIRDLATRVAITTVQSDEAVKATNTNEAIKAIQDFNLDIALSTLIPKRIEQQFSSLQDRSAFIPNSSPISLSVATGQSFSKLPAFNYQLGAEGAQHADLMLQQSPLFQLQVHLYKNWHFNTGIQYLNTTINEQFEQTKVFSYDEKEHYLFPYIYGFRQISDEELQEGPWPFGPNPPGGGDVSHVKANYQSEVRSQHIIIPLTLSYHQQFGVFEAQLHAGVGLNFPYRTSQTLHIPGYAPSTIYIQHPMGQIQAMAQSQLRLSYLANRHLSVFIEPQIRSAFQVQNELHTLPYRNNTKAIYAGLSWKF